jgi:hypothetical protein
VNCAGQAPVPSAGATGQAGQAGFVLSFHFLYETEKTKIESHVQAFNPVDHVNPV